MDFYTVKNKCFGKGLSPWKVASRSLKKKYLDTLISLSSCPKKHYPVDVSGYVLGEEVGYNFATNVYKARCIPFNETVAIKIIDLEKCGADLDEISLGIRIAPLLNHPNIMKVHCSFVVEHYVWIVMPYMTSGSCLHLMKASFQTGFEEAFIAFYLQEVLKGLMYLHEQGQVHRNIKATNILVDSSGLVGLGDIWFSTRNRNTFWTAPELNQQTNVHNPKVDIWSIGVTALELSHGPEACKENSPIKVLDIAMDKGSQGNSDGRRKKLSKSFLEMITQCLAKDPMRRPSAKRLLRHTFFSKYSLSSERVSGALMCLPLLGDQVKAIKLKEGIVHGSQVFLNGEKEALSQNGCRRINSGWNFELEDSEIVSFREEKPSAYAVSEHAETTDNILLESLEPLSYQKVADAYIEPANCIANEAGHCIQRKNNVEKDNLVSSNVIQVQGMGEKNAAQDDHQPSLYTDVNASHKYLREDMANSLGNDDRSYSYSIDAEVGSSSMQSTSKIDDHKIELSKIKELEHPEKHFEVQEDIQFGPLQGENCEDKERLSKDQPEHLEKQLDIQEVDQSISVNDEIIENGDYPSKDVNHTDRNLGIQEVNQPVSVHGESMDKGHSMENPQSHTENMISDREKLMNDNYVNEYSSMENLRRSSSIDILEGQDNNQKLKAPVVEQKGRFKVTTGDADVEKICSAQNTSVSCSTSASSIPMSSILPFMQKIAEHNDTQTDQLMKLIKTLGQSNSPPGLQNYMYPAKPSVRNSHQNSMPRVTSEREQELQQQLEELENRALFLASEIEKGKLRNMQLEKELKTIYGKEENKHMITSVPLDSVEKCAFTFNS